MITAWIVSVLRIWRVGICTFAGLTPRNRAELSVAACGLSNGVTPFSSTIQVHRAGRSSDTSPSHPARKRLPRELQIVNRPKTHPVRNTEIVETFVSRWERRMLSRVSANNESLAYSEWAMERLRRRLEVFAKTPSSVFPKHLSLPICQTEERILSDCNWHRLSTPQKL